MTRYVTFLLTSVRNLKIGKLDMTVSQLIKHVASQTFQELSIRTKVDIQVKKLSEEIIFRYKTEADP